MLLITDRIATASNDRLLERKGDLARAKFRRQKHRYF